MVVKKLLFSFILFFLIFSWLEQQFALFDIADLKGQFTKSPSPSFSFQSWFDGSFQTQKENYLNENFGFRNTLVRLNNQIAFSFYNRAKSKGVIIGKENYLYGDTYINAYYGNDFLGEPKIQETVRKLKFLRETFKRKNIDLMVVIVPGKASFFPEFLPEQPQYERKVTNYQVYKDQLKNSGIPFMDLCSYYISQKKCSPYPLFSKTGIHWSAYASELAADTIARFISKMENAELPHISITKVQMADTIRGTDYDIEEGMNLLFRIPTFKMPYPSVTVDMENKTRPRVLTIADSYYWSIYGNGRAGQIFTEPHFWYYYTDLYIPTKDPVSKKDVDLRKEIEQQDVIMIFANDARTLDLGSGFIEDAYDLYSAQGKYSAAAILAYEEIIRQKMEEIRVQKDWFESLKKVSMVQNLPLDTVLRRNAIYIYEKTIKYGKK